MKPPEPLSFFVFNSELIFYIYQKGHLSIYSSNLKTPEIFWEQFDFSFDPKFGVTYLGMLRRIEAVMGMKQVSDTKSWETDVMSSSTPVFVDFWAEWCGPCRMVSPVVEELAEEYNGKVDFVKVNVDEANEIASKYNVFSIPTLAIFNKGEIIAQQVGAASKESYKNMIEKALEKV